MKTIKYVIKITLIGLLFPTALLGKGFEDCSLDDYFFETRINNSDLVFRGERIERKKYWRNFCGKRTIQECPDYEFRHKIKVLETYKGSPPSTVIFFSPRKSSHVIDKQGSVRLVLSVVEAPDYDEVFFSNRYSHGWGRDNCFSNYDFFAKTYLYSFYKKPDFEEVVHEFQKNLKKVGLMESPEPERRISKAPNPFSKKKSVSPKIKPGPPFEKEISSLFQLISSEITRGQYSRFIDAGFINPFGELFSLWVSRYPEFEKEVIARFEKLNYKPGQPVPESKSPERELMRLWAMSLSEARSIEIKKNILPILMADFEGPASVYDRWKFRPYLYEVAAYHLAKTGLPEVKEFLEPLVLKENPKQQLALWALNLFNRYKKTQKESAHKN